MSYENVNIRKFSGLYLQPNSFGLPDGAMEVAENVVISRDDTITSRRGFPTFFTPDVGITLNTLATYQNKLIAICNDRVYWIDENGVATQLSGTITATLPVRYFEANKNFYFTTDTGLKKLTAYNSAILDAGVSPALDCLVTQWLTPGSSSNPIAASTGSPVVVGYRVVFGRRDANNNLLLGAPSDVAELTNRCRTFAAPAATWSRSGAVITITATAHGHVVGGFASVNGSNDITALPNGVYVVQTTPTADTFTVIGLNAGNPFGTCGLLGTRQALVQASIPSGVNAGDFFQVYRSTQSTTVIPDYKIIAERVITSGEKTLGLVTLVDDVPVISEGAQLYTNPNSREGELQANYPPPLCNDVTYYKGYAIYAGTLARALLPLSVISTVGATNSDTISIRVNGGSARVYRFRDGVANNAEVTLSITGAGPSYTFNTTSSNGIVIGDRILITNVTGGSYADQVVTVTGVTSSSFTATPVGTGTPTRCLFQVVQNAANQYVFDLEQGGLVDQQFTAEGLVKAINRDPSSEVWARYISAPSEAPGRIQLIAKNFNATIEVICSSSSAGAGFFPTLPTTYGAVASTADDLPNASYYSKVNEPEAVAILNRHLIGSQNKEIQRCFALRDSILYLKDDGIFRQNGDVAEFFQATILDNTIFILAASSAALINNQVVLLSNQGVCLATENAVQIISRRIELPIVAVLGASTLAANTSAVTYESERLYILRTLGPDRGSGFTRVTWVYNTLTETWTTWDTYFKNAVVGPGDKLFYIDLNNVLRRERKNQNKLDFCDDSYSTTVVSIAPDQLSGVITSTGASPSAGDILVQSNVITKIRTASLISGTTYALTFWGRTNLVAAQTPLLYKGINHDIVFAPFHAGKTNVRKQFAQYQVHTRDQSITNMTMSFSNDIYGGSEVVEWNSSPIAGQGGWGDLPWGVFPWGLESGTTLQFDTTPAAIVRTYIPRLVQRGIFIKARLQHRVASESLNIQATGFQVRGYGEKVSR